MMKRAGDVEKSGVVLEALPNATFRVVLEDGSNVLATISGKMRLHHIRILPGDQVVVLVTPYDKTRGRVIYRQASERGVSSSSPKPEV